MNQETFRKVFDKHKDRLDPNGASFCQRVYQQDQTVYQDRVRAIGFSGKERILDAGCGFGQWSLALAHHNQHVTSVDVDGSRLMFLQDLVDTLALNIEVKWSSFTETGFDDNHFDAIFCYGVIFVSDWKQGVQEFHRILKPGGNLYFTFNDIGWYLHQWLGKPNAASNHDPSESAAKSFLNTWRYKKYGTLPESGQIMITDDECETELSLAGFKDISFAADGQLRVDPSIKTTSFFPEDYDGFPGIREVLARKP